MAANPYIQKLQNGLTLHLPQALVDQAGLQPDDEVTITVQDGRIVLTPVKVKAYTLAELVEGITDDNRPSEWDMGAAVGHEVW